MEKPIEMDMDCSTRMVENTRNLANYCSDLTDWTKVAQKMLVVANQEKVAGSSMQLLCISENYIVKVERMKMGRQAYMFAVLAIGDAGLIGRPVPLLPLPL